MCQQSDVIITPSTIRGHIDSWTPVEMMSNAPSQITTIGTVIFGFSQFILVTMDANQFNLDPDKKDMLSPLFIACMVFSTGFSFIGFTYNSIAYIACKRMVAQGNIHIANRMLSDIRSALIINFGVFAISIGLFLLCIAIFVYIFIRIGLRMNVIVTVIASLIIILLFSIGLYGVIFLFSNYWTKNSSLPIYYQYAVIVRNKSESIVKTNQSGINKEKDDNSNLSKPTFWRSINEMSNASNLITLMGILIFVFTAFILLKSNIYDEGESDDVYIWICLFLLVLSLGLSVIGIVFSSLLYYLLQRMVALGCTNMARKVLADRKTTILINCGIAAIFASVFSLYSVVTLYVFTKSINIITLLYVS